MLAWMKEIAKVRAEVRSLVEQALATLVIATLTGTTTSRGEGDAVESSDESTDSGDAKGSRPVTRISPWGIVSRPPKGLRGLSIRFGSSNVAFLGILPTDKYGPQDLEAGETALYNSVAGVIVKLNKDGDIVIIPKSGQKVLLAGASDDLALATPTKADIDELKDKIQTHTHSFTYNPGTLPIASGNTQPSMVTVNIQDINTQDIKGS